MQQASTRCQRPATQPRAAGEYPVLARTTLNHPEAKASCMQCTTERQCAHALHSADGMPRRPLHARQTSAESGRASCLPQCALSQHARQVNHNASDALIIWGAGQTPLLHASLFHSWIGVTARVAARVARCAAARVAASMSADVAANAAATLGLLL